MQNAATNDERIRLHIEENCCRGLTVKELAAALHMDPGNLDHDFRRATGFTIGAYTNRCRKRMLVHLANRDHPYGYEIGNALGFRSDKTFYRWVKRQFGLSWEELRTALQPSDSPAPGRSA